MDGYIRQTLRKFINLEERRANNTDEYSISQQPRKG